MFKLSFKSLFELLLFVIMVALLAQQTYSGLQLNAKYMFSVDVDGTIVVMNTQTAELLRCDREFRCANGQDLTVRHPLQGLD